MLKAWLQRKDAILFFGALATLTLLSVVPFWRTTLLPMQDYPHLLVFARAFRDHTDPSSPFHGTYTTGHPLSPTVLPLLVLRGLWRFVSLETAGKIVWSCYAIALPIAAYQILRALQRDRWAVFLLFPLLMSYWVVGGFFAFATSAPLVLFGLALGLRWLEDPSWRRGAGFAALLAATFLWHALSFAMLVLNFGLLWILWRAPALRARFRALLPLVPAAALYVIWFLSVIGTSDARSPSAYAPFAEQVPLFFEYIGPIVPGAIACAMLLGLFVLGSGLAPSAEPGPARVPFRVKNPFAWLSFAAATCYVVLPLYALGVAGISNRFPWWAAVLLVFAWNLPRAPAARAAVLGTTLIAGVAVLFHFGARFAAFDRESAGASRLIDRLSAGQTLFAPIGAGATASFPGHAIVHLGDYAAIRNGGLPNTSFAQYDLNFIRYATGRNPMPDIWVGSPSWLVHPDLKKFDYVLTRGPYPAGAARGKLAIEATDGEWTLAAVCGSKSHPSCAGQ